MVDEFIGVDEQLINAYTAGLFDGEGSVVTHKSDKWYSVGAQITLTDYPTLMTLQQRYGGRIRETTRYNRKPNWSRCWAWSIFGKEVQTFYKRILPYSDLKKDQIILALLISQHTKQHGAARWHPPTFEEIKIRENAALQIRQLNHRRRLP